MYDSDWIAWNGKIPRCLLAMALVSVCVGAWFCVFAVAPVVGAVCPNEHIRLQEGYAAALPDCRAYEQASPSGDGKNLNDALGVVGFSQSSPSGDSASYFSLGPFAGIPGASDFPTYLSTRGVGGDGEGQWLTRGVLPPAEPGAATHVLAFTEDLSKALASVGASQYLYDSSESLFVPFPSVEVFSGASVDDSHILFENTMPLVAGAKSGVPNLYEWEAGRLLLADVLPESEGTPAGGATAGPAQASNKRGFYYTQGSISEDGSRVFFTALKTSQIYMTEPTAGRTVQISSGPAEWLAATPSGSEVFYTEGGELYRFDVESNKRELLTQGAGAEVLGALGISNDGSYVYFVAKGALSGAGAEGRRPAPGANNLYEWHRGGGGSTPITYIVELSEKERSRGDESDWRSTFIEAGAITEEAANGEKSSRVASDGATILFSSVKSLTGYDNRETHELYLYDAVDAKLTCVSCNPYGPAITGAYLARPGKTLYTTPRIPFLTRNLSANSGTVFFQTEEALVAKDTNGLSDVYEWEGGHLYLISSGQGDAEAYFADASASGDNVFFFTRQPLVRADQDGNADLYDARVDGGIAAQNPVVAQPCVGEECHGQIAPASVFGAPASTGYSGTGNLLAPQPAPTPTPPAGGGSETGKLAVALRACKKKTSSRRRAACRARAEKRYAGKAATAKRG